MDSVRAWPAVGLMAALALLSSCGPREQAAPPEPAAPPQTAPTPPPTPPVVGRAELLAAVAAAASAVAAGDPPPAAAGALAGRRFALRLPFGCFGPSPDAAAGYAYDATKQVLKLSARPEPWTDADWARELAGTPSTEAIEGFWIRRPWMAAEACPKAAPAPMIAPAPETVGLAQVFEEGGSRLQRRAGRPYEATEKLETEPPPGQGGFRLALEGRVAAPAAGGGPIRCRAAHPDTPPLCLVLVDIDRVAFEDAAGRQLAEWRN
ncbi:hypothetical protein ACO2Q0_01960 [Phenylobacterium sp. VNQ135]|uniref:hypothetical protein n=1 Tax=Phenylobacterium sp. VNQ135 TaxID=3400922 RepID=UPI003C03BB47